ncbi:MAG: VWA domain-containing protein [Vicinamibacterales bacterium]
MRTRFLAVFLLALLSPSAFGQQVQAPTPPQAKDQQPPITFKVEVNYVEIDALVTDSNGKFVRGLTRDDFEVLEQSKPQAITVFSLVDIPAGRPDAPLFAKAAIEPDVRTNRQSDGRVFVLVLDDLHTHTMRSVRVRAAARQFVERYLGENDIAAIVTTGGSKSAAQNFTSSRRLLLKAIDAFMGQKLRSSTLEQLAQLPRQIPGTAGPADPLTFERAYKARASLSTLKGVAEYLEGIRGRRKAVVFFSEGIDYDMSNPIQNQFASDVRGEMLSAIAGASRANVSFYSVDPRGLSGFEDAIEIQSLPEDNSLGVHTMMDEMRNAQDSLRSLAEETGGFAAINRNDYRETFAKIIDDNSSYYVLGYYSSDSRRDGKFRPVDVRMRRPGLQVRARKGYTPPRTRPASKPPAASAKTSPELREALASPLPVSGLALSASAAAFRGPRDKASVSVSLEIDGSRFKFSEKGDRVFDEIEVSMVAYDAGGVGRDGGHDVVQLTLRPQTRDTVVRRGVRIMRRMELSPGVYQVRIGARETGNANVGTVLLDMDVPDFSKERLLMSGVVITSAGASAVPTARADEQFKDVLPGAPTTLREFARQDELATFVEVYDNDTRTPHRVEIKTTVLADNGTVVFTASEERRSEEIGPSGGGYGHTTRIPLKGLAPGRYVLRTEARSTLANGPTATRELEFRVQ